MSKEEKCIHDWHFIGQLDFYERKGTFYCSKCLAIKEKVIVNKNE